MMQKRETGFTIVELLIVIVVIGILAAITIVAYNGITQKAIVASMQSDLANVSQQLKIYQTTNQRQLSHSHRLHGFTDGQYHMPEK